MFDSGRLTVAIATLGCKVNQAESDAYAQRFADAGFELVAADQPADVCVINSCTVTNVGDQKSRQLIQRVRRANPDGLVAVTGCYAAIAPGEVERLTGADVVARLEQRDALVNLVSERLLERGMSLPARPRACGVEGGRASAACLPEPAGCRAAPRAPGPLVQASPRTRLNIKVQDGCNDFCTYCIVPFARGRARSVPLEAVVAQVRRAVAEGYQEVVLTGVNMTTYGRGSGTSFGHLLEAVLERTAIRRVRLSSIEPFKFDTAWMSLWGTGRLCRHLHLPLQSGCDATLQRMRRRYDTDWYARLIEDIRAAVPGMAIWTDVIAGFPGETDAEFESSLGFVRRMEFGGVHVFRYSPRSGTKAAAMDCQVMDRTKKARSERLLALSLESRARFAERLIGSTGEVLFEEDGTGLTDNYVRIYADGGTPNTFAKVEFTEPESDGLRGGIRV
ncbi:MAG: tRNA (N(6)-L-threonylcarbamoyladenosine(37)-C(2))-methylthiotransferase MtaB [Chloroflexota bacterium]|nr:tRNA (N(6)-L-threonylcarbamoyladenosine(37)-C(2))-methylthiotransferase MtaB [Chloroflexota bacterium]